MYRAMLAKNVSSNDKTGKRALICSAIAAVDAAFGIYLAKLAGNRFINW
jgi:hypothetical protein